nr:hypothetical protein Iba_chr13bCG15260 [Ipomoea batatas]GME05960.1 hypothetical protein Iba_scaffold3831CG0010 [Ipomoea batatas]
MRSGLSNTKLTWYLPVMSMLMSDHTAYQTSTIMYQVVLLILYQTNQLLFTLLLEMEGTRKVLLQDLEIPSLSTLLFAKLVMDILH